MTKQTQPKENHNESLKLYIQKQERSTPKLRRKAKNRNIVKGKAQDSADAAQNKRDFNNTAKDQRLKLGANFKLIEFIENKIIKDKYSPAAALAEVRKKGYEVNFCVKTLYNYIDEGLFAKLTNDDLPVKM